MNEWEALGKSAVLLSGWNPAIGDPDALLTDGSGKLQVAGPLTDAQLRATPLPVDVTPAAPGAADYLPVRLTDGAAFYVAGGGGGGGGDGAILDGVTPTIKATVTGANALKVDGSAVTQPVSGPLTDAQLRAAAVPVSGPLTDAQLRAAAVPVSGPLTDAQLRAADVAITLAGELVGLDAATLAALETIGLDAATLAALETISVANFPAVQPVSDNGGSLTVDGPLTDAQLRAAAVPVSLAATINTDVVDRAIRELGRARLWDGTDEATVLPVRTQPATTEKSLNTVVLPYRQPTYGTTTIAIAPAITVGVKELLALWHAAAGTKDIYITEISVSGLVTTASTAGRSALRVSTITAAPTGGTEEAKVDISGAGASDMTNTMRAKTGGGTIGSTFIRRAAWGATQAVNSRISEALFKVADIREAIILRAGVAAGISIDIEREVAHTALVDQWYVTVRWLEL